MPVKKHSVEQIIAKLREIEKLTGQGMSIPMAAKRVGVTDQTFYRWRIRCGALKEEARRLQLLEQENARLKRIVADQPDARGFTTTSSYAQTSNVLLSTARQIDATTSAVTTLEYGDAANPGLPTIVTAPRGNTGPTPNHTFSTSFSYNSSANLSQKIDADGNKTTYGYDSLGRQTTIMCTGGLVGAVNEGVTRRKRFKRRCLRARSLSAARRATATRATRRLNCRA